MRAKEARPAVQLGCLDGSRRAGSMEKVALTAVVGKIYRRSSITASSGLRHTDRADTSAWCENNKRSFNQTQHAVLFTMTKRVPPFRIICSNKKKSINHQLRIDFKVELIIVEIKISNANEKVKVLQVRVLHSPFSRRFISKRSTSRCRTTINQIKVISILRINEMSFKSADDNE
ncbi:hypothetical protein T4B_11221 [Trichinella pseudospiralis]|uniref:Uncharacterized protein n=2 Tax=Trichinella pseudospiralis TaxID=6337 RepID=A0A0V1FKU0_TRIPS|nr:hypothetical protein T4E_4239 [Trichinella pseudospiralis]KRY75492.1 hypothetical protein T4A_2133 [Trichinella pseudospiralis]KRY86649.1 hypothetical protein T4D_3838 [Trichinella pseudospiralis]KRZ24356.1 hypothetical protein T4B_11221 [Trichinella pseudospiralis]KRZ40894.1 hypothetical protein T4C_6741 [Trichinella pseudospiralis]